MKLLYKKAEIEPVNSFYVKRVKEPVLDINWHFHEEYEIIYIIRGNGVRLVGDNISNFQSGELVLVGPNMPHLWRTTKDVSSVDRIIIKFGASPNGIDLFDLPEFASIQALLKNSNTGISFQPDVIQQVHDHFLDIADAAGPQKWIRLLQILTILSNNDDYERLSSPYVGVSTQNTGEIRLSKVITYISENFDQEISLDEIADIASMTVQSFCRYFKKRTNKTFIQFLNEYRIGKACVLLIENKIPIGQIWSELGFNSSTNFNRFFKRLYGCTPMDFRKKYFKGEENVILAHQE
jgi:AraC-like DNA-binding protein